MAERERVYTFDFIGRTTWLEPETSEMLHAEVLPSLQQRSIQIGDEISATLRELLPPGVRVETQITFSRGSIEWAGVIIILDWMARLSGAIALIEVLKKATEIGVNRVVSRHIGRSARFGLRVETEVEAAAMLQEATEARRRTGEVWQAPAILILNTLLLIAILALTIWFRP